LKRAAQFVQGPVGRSPAVGRSFFAQNDEREQQSDEQQDCRRAVHHGPTKR
jgi:hypothetical protein